MTLDSGEIRHYFDYDPLTGYLTTRYGSRRVRAGGIAGNLDPSGYIRVRFNCKRACAHRVIWVWMTGEDPGEFQVDHIDGDRSNNRWDNLRLGTGSQNLQNQRKAKSDNKLGYLGVTEKYPGKFRATIKIDKRVIHLGYFDNPIKAHEAYLVAKRKEHEFNTL